MSLFRIVVPILWLFVLSIAPAFAGDNKASEFYRQGIEHNKKGEFPEAIRLYSKAIELKPDSASLFFVRGRAYLENKEYDKAIGDLGRAISLKPAYAEAYNVRGIAHMAKSEKQQGVNDFKKACSLGLNDACKNLK